MRSSWTEAQVRALLAEEDFSYQRVELPYGLSTGGRDRSATARRIFPDDMTGKTLLDLGCKYGYFCFEALERGASRAVGLDIDPDSVRKARRLAECLGLEASFEVRDIEARPIDESFDYVLCLNLLHHMKNPIAVLDALVSVTRERLVLEVASVGRHDRRKIGLSPFAALVLRRAPVIFVSRRPTGASRNVQKFFISAPAIDGYLSYHTNAFARVETTPSSHKSRYITIGHKRRIGELVVVAGPTASGKSELIERLRKGDLPELAEWLGMADPAQWVCGGAAELRARREASLERVLFEYDFLNPYRRSAKVHARDETLDLLDVAERVRFATLWRPPEALRERMAGAAPARGWLAGRSFDARRLRTIRREFEDSARVLRHYRDWFAFTRTRGGEHVVVSPGGTPALQSPEEWERLAAEIERRP